MSLEVWARQVFTRPMLFTVPRLRVAILAVVLIFTSACATPRAKQATQEKAPAAPKATPIELRYVGTITLVNDDERFVLIDSGNLPAPASGLKLRSTTGGVESGKLTVSNVQRRPFVIGDITFGEPVKGDQVFAE